MKKIKYIILGLAFILLVGGCTFEDTNSSSIATSECDIIINKSEYEICYDKTLKGAKFVSYKLLGSNVNRINIENRPSFYRETDLTFEDSSTVDDYTGSGYDMGHLANDASFDWDETVLNTTYSLANIIPQIPNVNRYAWSNTETEERKKAVEFGEVNVIIGVVYSANPLRIGNHQIAVPEAYYKNIYNISKGYKECYYYKNIHIENLLEDTLDDHRVSCSTLTLNYKNKEEIIPTPAPVLPTQPNFSCSVVKTTCSQMITCSEAIFYLNSCQRSSLDRDNDGVPCESICR